MANRLTLPSAQLAWKCASLSLDNAIKHLDWAQEMGKNKDWGIGTAHLVLSLEEGAKSVVLAVYGLKCIHLMQRSLDFFISKYPMFKLDAIDLEEIVRSSFYSHPTKHKIALWLLFYFWMSKRSKEKINSQSNIEFVTGVLREIRYSLRGAKELSAVYKWLSRADQLKKRGFYVDYEGKKSLTPDSVREDDYLHGLNVTRSLIGKLTKIREAWLEAKINRNDFIKQLDSERSNIENDISAEISDLFAENEITKLIRDAEEQ